MKKLEFDKLCIGVNGYEGSYLVLSNPETGKMDEDFNSLSAQSLMERTGGELVNASIDYAFDVVLNEKEWLQRGLDNETLRMDTEYVQEHAIDVERYRQATGRKFPPVYRMKLRVELEEASPEDVEKFWLGRVRTP